MRHELDDQLDFIQLLLEKGANPNVQNIDGITPVMSAFPMAPGAATFLLERPTSPDIDIHMINRAGVTLLDMVHSAIGWVPDPAAASDPDDPDRQVKYAFLLQQWREIEKMLVERGSQ